MGCTRSRGFQCLASSPRPGEPARYPALVMTQTESKLIRFGLPAILLSTMLAALLLGAINYGMRIQNLWLVAIAFLVIFWSLLLPISMPLTLPKFQVLVAAFCWWLPISLILTFFALQAMVKEPLFINHLMHYGDITQLVSGYVLLPTTAILTIISCILYSRNRRASAAIAGLVGVVPCIAFLVAISCGAIR